MSLVRRQQGTRQTRTPVCQPGSIPELHNLRQDFPSVSSSVTWDYPVTSKAPQALVSGCLLTTEVSLSEAQRALRQ